MATMSLFVVSLQNLGGGKCQLYIEGGESALHKMLICWCEMLMKDASFTDAKTDVAKKECNKPENAGKCDQKSEKRFRFS